MIVAVLGLTPASAPCQTATSRYEMTAFTGYSHTYNDESFVGGGRSIGAALFVDVTDRFAVGGLVERVPHDRMSGLVNDRGTHGRSLIAQAAARFAFGGWRVRPFIMGGAGILHYSGVTTTPGPIGEPARRFDRKGYGRIVTGAGGLEVEVTPHFSIQPHVTMRGLLSCCEDWMPWIVYGAGVGFSARW